MGVAAVAVAALPRTTVALGEKVLLALPVTAPATTKILPELPLLVFVNVRVPRPPLVTPSLLRALERLLSARAKPNETSPTVVTSVEPVPATVIVEVEAAEFVMKPELVTDWVTVFRSKPLRSRTAPALTTIELATGIAVVLPSRSKPALTFVAPV